MSQAPAHPNVDEQGHDEHGHDHPWFLGHHWENPAQQFEAGKLGMWLFLATEILLFGGLFCGYAVWRGNHPELFKFGSQFLNTTLGATNTAVLIASSLSMAWAVTAAQQNKQRLLKVMLLLTLAGATTFLVIKYFEYTHKFHEGIYPGVSYYDLPGEHSETFNPSAGIYDEPALQVPTVTPPPPKPGMPVSEPSVVPPPANGPAGFNAQLLETIESGTRPEPQKIPDVGDLVEIGSPDVPGTHAGAEQQHRHHMQDPYRPRDAHMFFNLYFLMTGLHGIHVAVGMIVIIWLFLKASRGQFSSDYFTPLDLGGLYWHVVDLIWIFLFPLFYLI